MARDVNFVWNVSNDLIRKNWKESRKITKKSDLNGIVKGASKYLSLNQQSVQAVAYETLLRVQNIKKQVKFRTERRNLGYIPFNGQTIKIVGDKILYDKKDFTVWKSRNILGKIKMGSFNQDSRGRWYISLVAEVEEQLLTRQKEVGVDLGLISTATTSVGKKLSTRKYRRFEKKLAMAQRAGKKKLVKTIHTKIKNSRKDDIEKFTTALVKENDIIFIGNVGSQRMVKTKLAKSVLDNSWSFFKTRIAQKTKHFGGRMIEVNEAYTSRTCSCCGIGWMLPKGLKSLAIREYVCPGCGVEQDRDINAARNILRIGHDSLIGGIPSLYRGEDVNIPLNFF